MKKSCYIEQLEINLAALVERRHARHASFQNCIVVRHAISSLLGKKVCAGWMERDLWLSVPEPSFILMGPNAKDILLRFSNFEFSMESAQPSKYIRAWRLFNTSTIGNAVRGRMHVPKRLFP
jgi:hypothetical protein